MLLSGREPSLAVAGQAADQAGLDFLYAVWSGCRRGAAMKRWSST